jgi:cell division protein FtsX
MTVSIIGANEVTRFRRRRIKKTGNAASLQEWYKGPIGVAEAFFNSNLDNDDIDEINLSVQKAHGVITITYSDNDGSGDGGGGGGDDELEEIWEILSDDLEKDLRQHDEFNKTADQGQLEAARQAYMEGDYNKAPAAGVAEVYHTLLMLGVTSYVRTAAILQRTIRVGRQSAAKASWAGVDQAWKLQGEEGSPDPTEDIIGVTTDMPEADESKKQWLKRGPNVRQVEDHGYEIVQSWWFAANWSNTLYVGTDEDGNT